MASARSRRLKMKDMFTGESRERLLQSCEAHLVQALFKEIACPEVSKSTGELRLLAKAAELLRGDPQGEVGR
ncbi:MAG: hypothetical protein QXY83_01085 [Thermosphaera sp.]